MARRLSPARRPERTPRRGGSGGSARVWLASALVVGAVALVVWIAGRGTSRSVPEPPAPDALALVRTVAGRQRIPPDWIEARTNDPGESGGQTITIAVRPGFSVAPLVLALQAEFHNQGGHLDPRPLAEGGGYGLARLDGKFAGGVVRVVVLGERVHPRATVGPPRPTRVQARQDGLAELAIVLDDAGNRLDVIEQLAALPIEVAVAVLPNASHSREAAQALARQGRDVLLHLPMEPITDSGVGAGPGAVTVDLDPDEVAARVHAALAVVTGACGVNNHMGSRATAHRPSMDAVMAALGRGRLFFLDSRTTPDTVAEDAARAAGIPALRRDVFLDVVAEPAAIRGALRAAAARAVAQGHAVAIGHVHPETIEALLRELPTALDGVTLVRPSQLARELN